MKPIEELIKLIIRESGPAPIYNCILYLNNPKNNTNYKYAFGKKNAFGGKVDANYCFRVGSITKTFTATIIMQLIEEGSLNLDDIFLQVVNEDTRKLFTELMFFTGVNYSDKITIKNLLEHSSGIRDYFADDTRFFKYVMKYPAQSWRWETIMLKYFEYNLNHKGVFVPGTGFHYSDTNYLLLAVLIQELTTRSFHVALQERILDPLALNDTFLEFYQDVRGASPIVFPFYGSNYLKEINSSFDWGGGGLISSVNDLDVFIRSLLSGKLFKRNSTLKLMTDFDGNFINSSSRLSLNLYAMGLQQKKIGDYNLIGHNSAYGGMMFYDINTDVSIILTINQSASIHKAEWLAKKLIEGSYI